MIQFNYETNFKLSDEKKIEEWISKCIKRYNCKEGEINYVFCDDAYLHRLNVEFLNHDTFTDIISFDYTLGSLISGDIFISVERVRENAKIYSQLFDNELNRVIAHGILHYIGYSDKSEIDKAKMREEENNCLQILEN